MIKKSELNSREIALNILEKVFINNSFSNILLNDVSNNDELGQKNKNLIFAIVHGTISRKIYLDYVASKFIDPKNTNFNIKIIIWMSLYQIKFLDNIPEYAIVNEAVELAKSINVKLGGIVNAVLKKVLNNKEEAFKININNDERRFCVEWSFPFKLYKMIKDGYGEEVAKRVAIDSVNKPEINFRVNTLLTTSEDVYEKYKDKYRLEKIENIDNSYKAKLPIIKSSLYKEGKITIQDKASILVAQTLNPAKDTRVLDMCAAPGGKLTHLAAIMDNTGYIKAYELNANRIKLIEENMKRLNVQNVDLKNDDALNSINDEAYDYVLLDAPCSGFGVLKRKPEIKLHIDWNYLDSLYEIQANLLDAAYKVLKTNGEIVYSTCTININENQKQIDNFLNKYKDMKIISTQQLLGDEINSDGFFICKMKKVGN